MRRRETGLGYWLDAPPDLVRMSLWARVKRIIQPHLESGRFKSTTAEFALTIDARVVSPEALLSDCAAIRDGLGHWAGAKDSERCRGDHERHRVRTMELLPPAVPNQLPLPGDLPVRVSCQKWLHAPSVRSIGWDTWEGKARLRAVTCSYELGPIRSCSLLPTRFRPLARTGTPRMAALPQTGRSVELAEMKEAERESFLREAIALKKVLPGRGELLAVFRNVPIELVARLSFSKESRRIHYDVTLSPSLRRTRVHDVAAVRDLSTQEIHLVPHRTRYRTVFLL